MGKDEDYDDVVEEQLADEDDEDTYILSKITEVIHSLMVAYRSAFLPILDNLIPHIVRLLAADRPWPDHQWGICVFDDVIEFAGPDREVLKPESEVYRRMLNIVRQVQGNQGVLEAFHREVLQ